MQIRRPWLALLLLPLWFGSGCDNVGRAFDGVDPPEEPQPGQGTSPVQVVPIGGDAKSGRPQVRAAYPSGAGWQPTVPIVVEFSESVNESSIVPTSAAGSDGRIVLRVRGATQVLPCQYDLRANGRLLVMRPVTELTNAQSPTYEVVLLPEARDSDGVRFQVATGGTVLTDFQVNQDPAESDGRILAVFPRDNQRDLVREGNVWVVFDRPANAPTLVADNLHLRPQGGEPLEDVTIASPLTTLGAPDPRLVRLTPGQPLLASTTYELVVTADITFSQDGNLDFRGRTPFARFGTVAPLAPTGIELQNPTPGYPNKINRNTQELARLRIKLPTGTEIGDRVRARIYGGNPDTTATSDLRFIERTAEVTTLDPPAGADGASIDIDFAGTLGNATRPGFDDGAVTFAAQIVRGSSASGFAHATTTDATATRFDITAPTLVRAGPPSSVDGRDFLCDVEFVPFYAQASEGLAAARLTTGANAQGGIVSRAMYASDDDGTFMMYPAPIGRRSVAVDYQLELTDLSGNSTLGAPITGTFRQRGFLFGDLPAGQPATLVVEAYDQATLQPIANATVLIDVGIPTLPATTQLAPGLTGPDGRVPFAVTGGNLHTITIVSDGYDLITLTATPVGFVSLPLVPLQNRTATWTGTLTFPPVPGGTVILGNTAIDGGAPMGVQSRSTAPSQVPDVAVVPNRPQLITGFAVPAAITAQPTFLAQGMVPAIGEGLGVAAPGPPGVPGGTVSQNLSLVTTIVPPLPNSNITSLLGVLDRDFAGAAASGLVLSTEPASLPRCRVTMSVPGFAGQAVAGIGFTQPGVGSVYRVDAQWGQLLVEALKDDIDPERTSIQPVGWVVVEASDNAGRISRNHTFLDLELGSFTAAGFEPPAIPVITSPTQTFLRAPLVTYADVVTLDPLFGRQGIFDIAAQDAAGRRWLVLQLDRDDAGGTNDLQFPDIAAAGRAGLAAGSWDIRVEARAFVTVTQSSVDNFMLTERTRQEVNYSRSASVVFTVQ
jgi:hypothetical protein